MTRYHVTGRQRCRVVSLTIEATPETLSRKITEAGIREIIYVVTTGHEAYACPDPYLTARRRAIGAR